MLDQKHLLCLKNLKVWYKRNMKMLYVAFTLIEVKSLTNKNLLNFSIQMELVDNILRLIHHNKMEWQSEGIKQS
jgi:hypothetical protein